MGEIDSSLIIKFNLVIVISYNYITIHTVTCVRTQ